MMQTFQEFSDESDNICTPSPPKIREVSPEYDQENLDRSPCKKPAGKTKNNTSNKSQKNKMKSKSVTTSRPKGSSGKQVRKKRTKENLGPAYISPPSSPSSPPVIDTANEQFSPPHASNPPNDLLCAGSSDVASGSSIPTPPHSGAARDNTYGTPCNPSTGHPDISDLFLDPQSPLQSDHTSVEPVSSSEYLCRNNGVSDAGSVHTDYWNSKKPGSLLMVNDSAYGGKKFPSHSGSETQDAHVSIDDLFG